jgi:error-prone DNA polymerase
MFDRDRLVLMNASFLVIDGVLQNQSGVLSVRAERIRPLEVIETGPASHDFH